MSNHVIRQQDETAVREAFGPHDEPVPFDDPVCLARRFARLGQERCEVRRQMSGLSQGRLFDPYRDDDAMSELTATDPRRGRPVHDFALVSREVFDNYRTYLANGNPRYLGMANQLLGT